MKYHIKIYLLTGIFFFLIGMNADGQQILKLGEESKILIYNESEINTSGLETSPAFYRDRLAFVYNGELGKKYDKDLKEDFFKLGFATILANKALINKQTFIGKINNGMHEGPMSFDPHDNRMYFTRSVKDSRRRTEAKEDSTFLNIVFADLNKIKPVVETTELNIEGYHSCHPSLSQDSKSMVFSSNRHGSLGKMDLFWSNSFDNKWSGIINIGDNVNSVYNEIFPFLYQDSILIYSSDRPEGMGGLDLYASALRNGSWTKPVALPAPFNSIYDDLGMIVSEDSKHGYFASNRPGGKGKDDIYRFETSSPLFFLDNEEWTLSYLTVLDKFTLEPINNASVTITPLDIDPNNFTLSSYNIDMLTGKDPGDLILKLTPKKGGPLPVVYTDESGIAVFNLKKQKKYLISAIGEGFEESSLVFDYLAFGAKFNMVLEPNEEEIIETQSADKKNIEKPDNLGIKIPTDVGSSVIFENIYYDYNSSNIQPGAALELDVLANIMKANIEMEVRLESHTDCRGTAVYNLLLSIERAEAARNYLVNLGIDADRIEIKGYGETKLRNKCSDDVICSDEKHSYNRRTEVVITR